MNMTNEKTSNAPTHRLCVIEGEGDKARFIEVAGLWTTKSGEGFTGTIPSGLSITGRIGVFPIKSESGSQ